MKGIIFFLLMLLLSGCLLDQDPSGSFSPCINEVHVSNPNGVDSAWATITCDDSVLISNRDGVLLGYPDSVHGFKNHEYRNEDGLGLFTYEVKTENPIWHGKDEIKCRLDMDVFCDNEKYPFIEYEWSFHQKNRRIYWIDHIRGGGRIPVKNNSCGNEGRFAVEISTPRDSNCADKL
jgi:hypothetical protein